MKVCVITNIPNPYRIPLFNTMDRLLKFNGIELIVIFGAGAYARRRFKLDKNDIRFNYKILNSRPRKWGKSGESYLFSYSGLYRHLKRIRPDFIVSLGFSLATYKVLMYKWLHKIPFAIWSGSIKKQGRLDSRVRLWQRRFLITQANSYIAYGTLAKEYFKMLGAGEDRIHIALNTVETGFFEKETKKIRNNFKVEAKEKHLVYVGYLFARKNVAALIEAVSALSETRDDFILDIIGDGPERKNLELKVEFLGLKKHVIFHGFKQKNELPPFLARANCFLFQTDFDIWGLVLNEAMAAGLPCISSVHAGATRDLIVDGETGFAMDFADTDKVVEKINWILDNPEKARQMGKRAAEFIRKNASLEKSVEGFVKAIVDK